MFCDATGKPDPNGDFEIINGKHCLREGRMLRYNPMMCDNAPAAGSGRITFYDAKTDEPPKSIDEAVAAAFKAAADRSGGSGDVATWLASIEPKQVDEIVTQAAIEFVRSHQGAGVAKHFATDSLDAELTYRLTQARLKHDTAQGYRPVRERTPFTASDAAATIAKATSARVASVVQANDSASEVERLRDEAEGARVARKHLAANSWRR